MARKKRRAKKRARARVRRKATKSKMSIAAPKKSAIEAIRKKTSLVERALQSLESDSKEPRRMKKINKWPKAVEEKIDFLAKTLTEINHVVKSNVANIKEVKNVLDNNYSNISTIAEILKHISEKDKRDKNTIYSTLSKKLTV